VSTQQQLHKTYWLCIFAINQHVSICHESSCCAAPAGERSISGHEVCEVHKFEEVMMMIKQHAVAMDANLTTFTRIWVLLELLVAKVRGMRTH
jgi:hypothetical protein